MSRASLSRSPRPTLAAAGLLAFALLGGGCAHQAYHPQPLSPAGTAAAFDARSLDDPGLRQFLAENLGRDFRASSPADWDFDTLAWVAFYFNPSLDVARAQWESARAALVTAGARPNPTLGITPGFDTNAPHGVSPWLPAITFDLPIETAGKRDRRADAARHAAEAAREEVFSAAWKVRADLRAALLDFAAAGPHVDRLRAAAATQHRTVALLQQRLQAGAIATAEVASARLAAVRADAAVAEAETQLPLARQRVAAALGVPASALAGLSLKAPAPVPPLSPDQLAAARRASLQSRPDVLAALARYEVSESALALEIAKQTPDLHLGPGYQWDLGENKWSLGFTFELPLFNHNEGPIAEAEAHRREAAAQFLATQAQAIAAIDAASAAQAAASARLDALRRAQRALDEQRARVATRRRAGAADALETESAALEAETGELDLLDAETQAALASGQLEDALQVPFSHLSALERSPRAALLSPP